MQNLSKQLEKIQTEVENCTLCDLCQGRTNTVFGDGNIEADLMFIGEGPGEQEDETGFPFVGRSGQLLSKMLDHCFGLTRDDVYIANIVKCRPPNNRDPEPEEIAICLRYLKQQIELIKPKVIVTLGRVATQSLLGVEERIGKLRGKIFMYDDIIPVVASWHPSYMLRRPISRKDAVKDMELVKNILQESLDNTPT